MAKNRLNKELDFIASVLKEWRTAPEKQWIEYLKKSLSVWVCVLLSLLVLRVSLGFDCISSWSVPVSKSLSVCMCASFPFGFEGGIGI